MTTAQEDVLLTLRCMVHGDAALQAKLFALTDTREFVAALCQLAQQSGQVLAEQDVQQAMRTGRQAWADRKLS